MNAKWSRGYLASVIIALVNSIPSLVTFFIVKSITNDNLIAIVVSSIIFVIAIGFSIKLAKRVLNK